MNRRDFLASGAAASLLAGMPRFLDAQAAAPGAATLSLDASAARIPLPADFTGLSYEAAQLGNPGYFSARNKELVTLVRQLGQGVLRLGGNASDFDEWTPEHVARNTAEGVSVGPDTGGPTHKQATVSESAIDNLRTFLDATGWKLIYGIDLGHGSPEKAADEAAYVVKTIGPALLALQIGNEPDFFFRSGLRKPTYGFADYLAEWRRFAAAILERTPKAPLAGPDVASHVDWVDQFAQQAKGIDMLTSHYYAEGPPTSSAADIPHLLERSPKLENRMRHLVAVAKSVGLPYRMAEGNSCYRGGKAGVSDTLASALWGADYMLLLAQLGVAGINFHGGGQGFYTPIAGGGNMPFQARPLYYGMLFYREFASGSLIPCKLETGGVNATAYACLGAGARMKLAILNKDLNQDLHLTLNGSAFSHPSGEMTLRAPSVESTAGVELAGDSVSAQGIWRGHFMPRVLVPGHGTRDGVYVPRASALLLEFENAS